MVNWSWSDLQEEMHFDEKTLVEVTLNISRQVRFSGWGIFDNESSDIFLVLVSIFQK